MRIALVLAVVCGLAMSESQVARRDLTRVEWTHYGGDLASTKYSPLDQINASNLKDLTIAWRWPSPDNEVVKANPQARPGGYEDTPLMVNGVLYTATSLGTFAAIDPETGKTIWQYDPQTWKVGRPGNLGYTHRGVAYWTDGRSSASSAARTMPT